MWKNIVDSGTPQMTIRRMRIVCWIIKVTNAHSDYVIIITFPLQQWLPESASMLIYKYIACKVYDCQKNCDNFPTQYQLTCFHNRDGVRSLRDTN